MANHMLTILSKPESWKKSTTKAGLPTKAWSSMIGCLLGALISQPA